MSEWQAMICILIEPATSCQCRRKKKKRRKIGSLSNRAISEFSGGRVQPHSPRRAARVAVAVYERLLQEGVVDGNAEEKLISP